MTTSQKLIRWSALAWLLSAMTGIYYTFFAPSDFALNAMHSSLWVPTHAALAISYMLFVFGLIGVYLKQAEKAGWLGSTGFVLSFFSLIILTAQLIVSTWILPILAAQPDMPKTAAALLDPSGPLAAFSTVVFVAYVPTVIGLVLLGIVVMRAGVLPRWAGLLLIIGTLLDLAVLIGAPGELIVKLGDLIFDAGKLWIVYALWSAARGPVMLAQARPAH
jgi:hypothetical protein